MSDLRGIDSVELFLAHALELEQESCDRLTELADVMAVHNDDQAEQLLRKLAHYSSKHAAEVESMTAGLELPKLAPWEFRWLDAEGPETAAWSDIDYLMTETAIVQAALEAESRGQRYYAAVAAQTPDPQVRRMAGEFAEEEAEHVEMIRRWLLDNAGNEQPRPDDLDPPNQPG